jgi:hypothetical protein
MSKVWLALCVSALFSTSALADTYQIDFAPVPGDLSPTSGSFTYSGGTFTNFDVVWDNITFDLTSAANDATGPLCSTTGSAETFLLLTRPSTCLPAEFGVWIGHNDFQDTRTYTFGFYASTPPALTPVITSQVQSVFPGVGCGCFADGSWTLTDLSPSAVPEPESLTAMLTAIAVMGFVVVYKRRRRNCGEVEEPESRSV